MGYKEVADTVYELLRLVFGGHAPAAIVRVAAVSLALFGAVYLSYALLVGIGKLRRVWLDEISPMFYNATRKRLVSRRQRFADHLESELRRLNNDEEWRDYRYAELEAEVEAEGDTTYWPVWRLWRRSTLRREHSLSHALAKSVERLILLEGDPGAGKSVALRHVARRLASVAMHSRSARTVIPLYVNLKTLDRPATNAIGPELIERHVLQTLNRFNSRDIDEFLTEEFAEGMRHAKWLFLFDSFDEIPEILSSVSADATLMLYTQAIADFLAGLNVCRGIVASRHFRGPRSLMWPRFRLLDLTDRRRADLVRRMDLPRDVERELSETLPLANRELAAMSRNPMFLGLLCEFARQSREIPENGHAVFEAYVSSRLRRDADKVLRRFGLDELTLRRGAEEIAIRMVERSDIGLSPLRRQLLISSTGPNIEGLDICLDALEYIRLGRREDSGDGPTFTFAHRRFQEYFATCAAIRQPDRLDLMALLLDGRWRETAVTMLQTQPARSLQALLGAAVTLLGGIAGEIAVRSDDNSIKYQFGWPAEHEPDEFVWPDNCLHLLGLLQSGLSGRADDVPAELQSLAGKIIGAAVSRGSLVDRRWALELCGVAPPAVTDELVRNALGGRSHWLADAAFAQAGRLLTAGPAVYDAVSDHLLSMFSRRQLGRSWPTTRAQLLRFSGKESLDVGRLVLWLGRIDIACFAAILMTIYLSRPTVIAGLFVMVLAVPAAVCVACLRLVAKTREAGWANWLGIVVRGLMTGMMISIVARSTKFWLVEALAVFLLTWGVFAIGAARRRILVRPMTWPLLVLWPVVAGARYVVRERREVAILLRDALAPIGFISVTICAIATGIVVAGRELLVVVAVVGVVAGIVVLADTAKAMKALWTAALEVRYWLLVRQRFRAGVGVPELVDAIQRLRGTRLQTAIVRFVRRRDLVVCTPDAAAEMYRAALDIERTLRRSLDTESAELVDEISMLAASLRQRQVVRG